MDDTDTGRERLTQIFRFPQAFNEHRNPAKRQVKEQEWLLWLRDLPRHPAVETAELRFEIPEERDEDEERASGDDFVIKVRRPMTTGAPTPPDVLTEWLVDGWQDPDGVAEVLPRREVDDSPDNLDAERFEDEARRVQLPRDWRLERETWAESERPARAAMGLFQALYEVHARIERESEQVELVLGEGILNWRTAGGGIHHPIILQRLELEFDPDVPEFIVRESTRPPELYTSLFRTVPDVDGKTVAQLREELENGGVHPLEGARTADYLARSAVRLSPAGEFLGDVEPTGEENFPRLGRQPVVYLRKRILGFAAAIEAILEDLPTREDLPVSLMRIAGIEAEAADNTVQDDDEENILLTKPANLEQMQIARRLAKHRAVLVQGPPGTGKTHTIANLIGHLLAEGKSVLVTSHTTKALRVLRDQVDPGLQPLCVSVLDADTESRDQLETSVRGIVERLSRDDVHRLAEDERALTKERAATIREIEETRSRLIQGREDEYREVVTASETLRPSDAARRVSEGRGADGWIPGPVERGRPMPLSTTEAFELYRTNRTLAAEDELELARDLPGPEDLVDPEEYGRLLSDGNAIPETHSEADYWDRAFGPQDPETLQHLVGQLSEEIEHLQSSERWRLAPMDAGRSHETEPWESLTRLVREVAELASANQENALRFGPRLSETVLLEEQATVLREIANAVPQGKRVGWVALVLRPRWRRVLSSVTANGAAVRHGDEVRAAADLALVEVRRLALRGRWERQMVPLGGISLGELGEPERIAIDYVGPIERCLRWDDEVLKPLIQQAIVEGFRWSDLSATLPKVPQEFEILKLREMILNEIAPRFEARIREIKRQNAERTLAVLRERLRSAEGAPVVVALRKAVVSRDGVATKRRIVG